MDWTLFVIVCVTGMALLAISAVSTHDILGLPLSRLLLVAFLVGVLPQACIVGVAYKKPAVAEAAGKDCPQPIRWRI